MILAIDASNISSGGGLTHLQSFLRHAQPEQYGFTQVVVMASQSTLDAIEDKPFLLKLSHDWLQRSVISRSLWRVLFLPVALKQYNCQLLFVPGGSYFGKKNLFVTMSRNLLPFQFEELFRFGWSRMTLKLLLLRMMQSRTFKRADGLIFLTQFAKRQVESIVNISERRVCVIPHGIDATFFRSPNLRVDDARPDTEKPQFKLLYVSIIDVYKHQWNVIHATKMLRDSGYSVSLELVGPSRPAAFRKMRRYVRDFSLDGDFWHYSGPCAHEKLPLKYEMADICVFASSCENMPNILMEGMASGLAIACSERGPMPEILGDAGVYFDPIEVESIYTSLKSLLDCEKTRNAMAHKAYERAKQYSWSRCSDETFEYLSQVAKSADCS